ncbi:MAG: wax ester/triacylglycerol synthase domain-containing protein, partial [Propionicimonas sp.]
MSDPVTVTEAALLARDQESQAWQQAFVVMLSGELTRRQVMDRVLDRIEYAPRFRKLVAGWPVPGWVDDQRFAVGGHVREATLPPGERLEEWLSAKLAKSLDRAHPLWELTVLHGVAPGMTALVSRSHPALVDGYDNVHLLQELFDDVAEPIPTVADDWRAEPEQPPGLGDVLVGLDDPVRVLRGVGAGLVGMVENAVRTLSATPRPQYLAGVEVDLDALAPVRDAYGATTHDVLLALATAGVRGWLADNHRELVDRIALVPLAVAEPAVLESAIGCRVAPSWIALPVSATSPADRLRALATMTRARIDTGVSVPARDLT